MKLKITHLASLAMLFFGLTSSLCFSQTASTHDKDFAPLDQWKAAVTRHDTDALKALYSTHPPARITGPTGELDADADVSFWMGLKARDLKIDISQADSPQPDLRRLVLKIEIHPAGSPSVRVLYVSAGEVWQLQADQWRMIAMMRSNAARLEQPLSVSNNIYSPGTDARAEIKEALAVASRQHKRVILVFGANWCYDCHVLDTAFHRQDLAAVLARNYEVVHVDVGRGDKNQDLMEQYEVPMKKGIPGLAVLDSNGKLLASQKNGEFENARALGPEDLLAFLNKWSPPAR
ncbi:MAG: thioredoxin family protein [Terriglobales bacterium]